MKKYFVLIVLFVFCSLLAHAENVLDTLWQIKRGALPEIGRFVGFVQNPVDSNIVVSISNEDNTNPVSYITNIDSKKGIIKNQDIAPTTYMNLWYLNDSSSLLVQTSHLEIINKNTYERVLLDSLEAFDVSYNKLLDISISCWNSSIKIYDTKEKKIIKEYNSSNYFDKPNVQVRKVVKSNYNNYLIYSCLNYDINSKPISQLVVLDSNGIVLYKDEKTIDNNYGTPYRVLALSNDQKLIAYITSENQNKIKILDLNTLQVVKSISLSGVQPLQLRFSPDDKKIFLGNESGLMYFDLETLKINWLLDYKIIDFNFDLFNPNIIYINYGYIGAIQIGNTTNVDTNPISNSFSVNYNPNSYSITLNMNLVQDGNLIVSLYNTNGSPVKMLENSFISLGEYTRNYNLSNLPQGAYYLQIKLNNEIIYPALNFIKVN